MGLNESPERGSAAVLIDDGDSQLRSAGPAAGIEPADAGELLDELRLLRARNDELERLLTRNPTTGLPIRRLFDREFERALDAVTRIERGPRIAIGLLRLNHDYDRIKNSRDRNRVLLFKTGDRMREVVGDNVYQSDRLDEFLLILRDIPNLDGAELRAGDIVDIIATPHEPPADDVRFGCHLGISVYPDHGIDREELLGNANIALRESERTDQPFVIYDTELGRGFREREELERTLRQTIQSGFGGFALNYQPFVDRSLRICGSEVLIRWTGADGRMIPPDLFIPVAEETGDIRFLGQWSLYQACRQLRHWHRSGHDGLFVSVNVSPAQFRQQDLVERVGGIIDSLKLDPSVLHLELTETTVMDDPADAIARLTELRDMGVHLALDDFGTGYSSLTYLREFPFDTLKVDRSFVTGIDASPQNRQIVKAIVTLARGFDMHVVAEGVETTQELEVVFDYGCDYVQGYVFSPAVSADAYIERVNAGPIQPPSGRLTRSPAEGSAP
ncbi:MAG: GGDEF domain-containing protein [Spirochaetaceae bacterium]|nr:MAG: GGDEF domain-containing protein [Spirochaetaceae bacterium]